MIYTLIGLILAVLFGVFFGSENGMDQTTVSYVFWGLIGACVVGNLIVIFKDWLCRWCTCQLYQRRRWRQRSSLINS